MDGQYSPFAVLAHGALTPSPHVLHAVTEIGMTF